MSTMTFHQACRAVIVHCPDPYAKSYAARGMTLHEHTAQLAQIPYILSNISRWRGPEATEVRATLKAMGAHE